MTELDVKILKLEPMRAASLYGFGPDPEERAWMQLENWAGPRGYLDHPEKHRIFGFNNPNPSPASPNYGYELWLTVPADVEPESNARIISFPGGLYAMLRLENITEPATQIPEGWKNLFMWVEDSPYSMAGHQWLEEDHRRPGLTEARWDMDLYLPITERV